MNTRYYTFAFSLIAFFSVRAFAADGNFDPREFSTGEFHGCPSIGVGSDPYLNSLKNRDKPPSMAHVYTITQILNSLPKTLPQRRISRANWTPQQRQLAARWESRAVIVEGYLIHDAVREGSEACNC